MADKDFTVTQSFLNEAFEYKDGVLIRKFPQGNRKAGSIAGCRQKIGYCILMINKKFFYVHRLIYLMHHGYMPKFVDHIDGNKSNNRIENLRECNHSENLSNRLKQKNNQSGHKNVHWRASHKKWHVSICKNKKSYSFGYFKNLEDAINVANKARLNLHQEFAKA